ncbi:MAG: Gfo/Idh/MocA family oxidoreductase [Tepidisphaeraceae bacterium]
MPNERVLLVGAGGIAGAWLPNIVKEQLAVVGVVDIKKENAQKRIDEFKLDGARAFDSLDAALRTLRSGGERAADFAIDLTIPDAHCDVTCKCLEAGLHVVGEKPMASTIEQAKRMVATAQRTGKLYMVSQSRRWDTNHATVAATARSGRLGTITTVDCDFYIGAHFGGFRDEMPSPLVLDMAIHHFDLVRMFTGLDAVSVYCEEWNPTGSWYKGDVAAVCLFEMQNGVRFTYRGSWCAEGMHTSWNGDWRVIGTDGTLLYDHDQPPRGQVVADRSQMKFHLPLKDLDVQTTPVEKPQFAGGLNEMLTFLRTGQRPQTECTDNIKSLAMVLAAIQSSREGRRVKIEV